MQGKWMGSSEQYYNQCEGARQGFLNSHTVQIDSNVQKLRSTRLHSEFLRFYLLKFKPKWAKIELN